MSPRDQLLDRLDEVRGVQGVRGALVATSRGAFAQGARSGLAPEVASDVAKTLRRMTVASATIGRPLEEVQINFGAARLLAIPLREDAVLAVLMERDAAIVAVRNLVRLQLDEICELLAVSSADHEVAPDRRDDVERILQGELGGALEELRQRLAARLGGETPAGAADQILREQIRKWLSYCNPSPYTLPLLVEGVAEALSDAPQERKAFLTEVQASLKEKRNRAMSAKAGR